MEQQQSTEVTVVIATPVLVVIILAIVSVSFLLYKVISLRSASPSIDNGSQAQNVVTEENGKQIITIQARGAYSPRTVSAKAGVQTILRMKTSNSYGCERAFAIPKMGIQKSLPATGETDIDLGIPEKGSKVFGTCSMGMYTVTLTFN